MRARLLAATIAVSMIILAPPATAGKLALDGPLIQGGLVEGHTEPGARVTLDGRPLELTPDGVFLFGFGRDDTGPVTLVVHHPDGATDKRVLEVKRRDYRIQRINGLPPKMVTPAPEVLERIHREGAMIAEVRARDTRETWFESGFTWPVKGPISGVYGSRRVLNGEPKRPHFGLDIAAPAGAVVRAPTDGVVALAEDDLYYTGGTVMIDHGYGLTSVYSHMSAVTVTVGTHVRQGDPIGRVGATGRVTGPHLDWRVNLYKTRLDPGLLLGLAP